MGGVKNFASASLFRPRHMTRMSMVPDLGGKQGMEMGLQLPEPLFSRPLLGKTLRCRHKCKRVLVWFFLVFLLLWEFLIKVSVVRLACLLGLSPFTLVYCQ